MTPAEYRTRLAALDLKAGEAARLIRVSPRTHRSWASGERAIPDTVERIFELFEALRETKAGREMCEEMLR